MPGEHPTPRTTRPRSAGDSSVTTSCPNHLAAGTPDAPAAPTSTSTPPGAEQPWPKVAKLKAREVKAQPGRQQGQDTAGQVQGTALAAALADGSAGLRQNSTPVNTLTLGKRARLHLCSTTPDGATSPWGSSVAKGLALAGLSVTATVAAVKAFRARAARRRA